MRPGHRPLAVAEPADPRGQSLEVHALLRHAQPADEMLVVLERLHERAVGGEDVLGIAGEGDPAERPLPFAEERADEGGHEAGIGEVAHARVLRLAADIVAVVEEDGALALQLEHGAHVPGHRLVGARQVALGIAPTQRHRVVRREPGGDVAVQHVVGRGLIRDDIGPDFRDARSPRAPRRHCRRARWTGRHPGASLPPPTRGPRRVIRSRGPRSAGGAGARCARGRSPRRARHPRSW